MPSARAGALGVLILSNLPGRRSSSGSFADPFSKQAGPPQEGVKGDSPIRFGKASSNKMISLIPGGTVTFVTF
jgi:hypothetical protein